MSKVIYDSNLLIALIDKSDKWRSHALKIQNSMIKNGNQVVFLDCVVNEVLSVLGKRFEEKGKSNEYKIALNQFKKIITEKNITWIYPEVKNYYADIIKMMEKYKGKLNFHDALIALYAKDKNIKYIASFDQDFDQIKWVFRIK